MIADKFTEGILKRLNRSLRCEEVRCWCQCPLRRYQALGEVGILDGVGRGCISGMIQGKRARRMVQGPCRVSKLEFYGLEVIFQGSDNSALSNCVTITDEGQQGRQKEKLSDSSCITQLVRLYVI